MLQTQDVSEELSEVYIYASPSYRYKRYGDNVDNAVEQKSSIFSLS